MRFRSLRLTTKLVVLFLAFGVIPMAVLAVIAYRTTNLAADRKVAYFETVATTIADKIDRTLFERYGDVQAFGLNRAISNYDEWGLPDEEDNTIVRAMNRYVDTYNIYYLTLFVDLNGRVVAVNSRDAEGNPIDTAWMYKKNFSEAPWFKALKAGTFTSRMPFTAPGNDVSTGTFIEDVHIDEHVKAAYPGDDGLTMGFSAPVYEDGQVIGYWSNRTKFSLVETIFQDTYAELKSQGYPGAELTLLDGKGRVLIDYDPSRTGKASVTHDFDVILKLNLAEQGVRAAQAAVAGQSGHGVARHTRKHLEQVVGWTHLKGARGYPGMNWAVLVWLPRQEALAGVLGIHHSIFLTVGISLGVILLLGPVVGRRLSRPLVQMAKVAQRIALGDLDQRLTHRSGDETGILADAFRDLIGYMKQLADAASALSRGDLNVQVTPKSEHDVLSQNFQHVRDTLGKVLDETHQLVDAAKAGRLQTRGAAEAFQGGYPDGVQGLNSLLEAIVAPIQEATRVLAQVAARDLTARMQGDYQGDFATIKEALNTAIANLDDGLTQVATGADQVAVAADQISRGSQALAQGASEQASTLEQVSSSLQEMASMSQQNAANAHEARSLAANAQHSADAGTVSMQRLSQAIEAIKRASDETAKIVKTIDDIAFQTNLLALNAAVEAARAGDAGKGFAVVADEVRSLAMRSAEAAKTTAQLIDEAVHKAGDGVTLHHEVLQNLEEIVAQVHKVTEVMDEITSSSEQQQQGVEQLNSAVGQLNQVTQQTAANAEEAASTAEELASQSTEMRHLVKTFQLSLDPATSATPPRLPSGDDLAAATDSRSSLAAAGPPERLPAAARVPNPEEVIPLDDDDFQTLQEF